MAADEYRNPDKHGSSTPAEATRVTTGIAGLNRVLGGGLLRGCVYVVEEHAGTGKTALVLQFLLPGRAHNEPCQLVVTSETKDELTAAARSHGWSLTGIELLELSLTASIAH